MPFQLVFRSLIFQLFYHFLLETASHCYVFFVSQKSSHMYSFCHEIMNIYINIV